MQQTKQLIVSKSQLKGTKATLQSAYNLQQVCCRICLQQMPPSETFIVCKCKGDNANVHEKCLLQWAKKIQKYRESFDVYYYHCQICKDKILLDVVTRLTCLRCIQISFCGQDFCCTVSSLVILFMGVAMLAAGIYLKLSTGNSDIEYLFDLTLSLGIISVAVDVVLSVLYYLLYNEILVVGILLSEEQRRNQKPKQVKISNIHGEDEQKRMKKSRNQNINMTEAFFMEQNVEEVRQIIDEARFQTLNRQQAQNQLPPRQKILFPQEQNVLNLNVHNENSRQNEQSLPQILREQSQVRNDVLREQSLVRNDAQNIHQRDYSTSTVIQYETRSIMVNSISIKSRGDYKNNSSSYSNSPMNNQSLTFSNIQNEISHNQIPIPHSIMIKKPNPLTRFRKTLDESMIRSEINIREQRVKFYGQGENEKVSQQGHEQQNDVQIYCPKVSNKKYQARIQNLQFLAQNLPDQVQNVPNKVEEMSNLNQNQFKDQQKQ